MKKKHRNFFLGLAFLAFFILGSCAQENVSTTAENSRKKNDTVVIALPPGTEPEGGFNPITESHRYGAHLFQTALLKRNDDLDIVLDLATDYEISEDGLHWTFNLRDDVKFSDGNNFDAHDVVFTFNEAKNSGSAVDLTLLESVEATNDYQVVFKLKQPNSTFIDTIINMGIVPEDTYDNNYGRKPIGTGPIKLTEYQPGVQLIVEPNPYYYGDPIQFNQVSIVWLSEDAAYAAAQTGEVDVAYIPTSLSGQRVQGMNTVSLQSVDNRGITYVMVPNEGRTTEEGYPIGNDVTSDYSIRRSIDLALDRSAMIEGITHGHGKPATSVADGMPWWNDELQDVIDEYGNVEAAIEGLESNGWVDNDGDGVREKDGIRATFDLVYSADDQTRQSIAINVSDQLREIGIEVTPVGMSWDQTEQVMHSTPVVMGWGGYDPLETYNLYHSSTQGVDYYNTGYYSNKKVDEYLEAAITATTEEEAMENWQKAHWDGETGFSSYGDITWSWLFNIDHIYLVDESLDIGNPRIQPHGRGWALLANINEWAWKE